MGRILNGTVRQSLLGTAAVVLFQYLLRLDLSRGFLLLFLLCNFSLLALFRWLSPRLVASFQQGFGAPYHLVLVGNERRTGEFAKLISRSSPFRIHITRAACRTGVRPATA